MSTVEKLEVVPLSSLRFDGGTQVREEIDREYQDELAGLFNEDNPVWPRELPPGNACVDEDMNVWLWEGFHRYGAAQEAGCVNVPVMVRPGTQADAQWLACSANKTHGLRRNSGDIANAIRKAKSLKPFEPNRSIARHVGCSHTYVNDILGVRENKSTSEVEIGNTFQKIPAESQIKVPAWASEEDEPEPDEIVDTEEKNGESGERAEPSNPSAESEEDSGLPANHRAAGESAAHVAGGSVSPTMSTRPPCEKPADEVGVPLPSPASEEAFRVLDLFADAERLIKQLAKVIDQIGKAKGGELLRAHYLKLRCESRDGETIERLHSIDLDNLRRELKHWRPFVGTCPKCLDNPSDKCPVCYGLPYVTETAWDRSAEKLREKVLKRKGQKQ